MHMRGSALLVFCALGVVAPAAAARENGASAAALGTADAVRSSGPANTAIYFNPAALAIAPVYGIEVGYGYDVGLDGHAMNVSLADSQTNEYVAAGLAYTYVNADEAYKGNWHDRSGHEVRGALSAGYRGPAFAVYGGLGLRFFRFALAHEDDQEAFTLDAGLIFEFLNLLRFGVVGYNLIRSESRYAPMTLGTAASFTVYDFTFSFDTVVDFTSNDSPEASYLLGAQYLLMGMLYLRAGAVFDEVEHKRQVAAGLGYTSNRFGIDLAILQNVSEQRDIMVQATFRFFVP